MTPTVGAPQPSRPPRAPSFTARLDTGVSAPGHDSAVEAEVRRALFQRLLSESTRAEIAHVLVCAVVGVLLWPSVPHLEFFIWGAAIGACTLSREWLRRRLSDPAASVEKGISRVRLVLAVTGLAWGVGAAAFMPAIPLSKTALLLVVLCGLAAGGVASVAADHWSFRYFLAGLLVPVPVGLLQTSFERDTVVAVILVVLFAAAMIVFHRNSHDLLFGHLVQSVELGHRERKAVQDRAYLDAMLASAPLAIAVIDRDGRIRGTNPQFTSLFGYDAAEVLNRHLNDLVVPRSEQAKASRLDQRTRKGETVAVEAERRRKDGTLVAVRASAAQVEGGGEGDVLVMYENISDRRRAEDALTQLASIVQSSEDAIIGQTLDGTIVTWNAAAQRLFGYAPGEVQGRPIAQLTPPDRSNELTMILDRIRRGEHVEHFETVRLRKDGTPVPVSLSMSLTRDAAGRIRGFSTIARDVREQVTTREALRDARDVAQRLAQTRSAFLANMSHEIRTPMNAILGLTELLLDTEMAPEQRHSLGLVQTSAETLLTLLNDILDFSKIEAEHLQLEEIAFDLPHLLESTMSLLAVRARERRLELVADVAPDVPAMVRGDPTRLRQILTNLISNAIKFTHQGEVVVSASREGVADGRATLRIAVRDTGIGIAAEKLETIFEEFSQADASMTRKYGGTGLGLAIARRLVRLMGGDLAVRSELEKGTEFSFTVTFQTEDAAAVAAGPGAVALAGRHALVVDDNATNRRIVHDILAAAGMQVTEAVDGSAGLDALRSAQHGGAPFDLAIIDAQMPGLDGFQLAEAVRDDAAIAATRLVMLTSAGQRGDGQRCRELGIRGYLPKPMSRSDLLEAVGAVLAAPVPEEAFVTRHSIAESRKRLQVLVAEDNLVNQEVAATMLRKRGHDVDVANNGREAVEAAGRKRYDVVLMDVQMPEMDGFEATHAIRTTEYGRTLPIIALTAHALSGERERCLAQGMSGYLTKPFKAHELFATVEGWATPTETPVRGASESPAQAPPPAPVDLEAFRHEMRAAGAEDAVDPVLDTFLQTAPDRVAALTTALASGAGPEIERAAHAFKSASATIGAKTLATLLQELEVAGKAGDVTAARRVGDGLMRESEAVIAYLRQVRAPVNPAP